MGSNGKKVLGIEMLDCRKRTADCRQQMQKTDFAMANMESLTADLRPPACIFTEQPPDLATSASLPR